MLDVSIVDRMLPPRLRSNDVDDVEKTDKVIKSITPVKHKTQADLIAKKIKSIALYVNFGLYTGEPH